MKYTIRDIADIIKGERNLSSPNTIIDQLLIDSRRLVSPSSTIFFALQTSRRNGEDFVAEMYQSGVRCFVVNEDFDNSLFAEGNFIETIDPLRALQKIVAYHRRQFALPVIGITGSNGKTIVKEWLYQLLNMDYQIVRSPKSYNSQIGVPLSVWSINESHTLGIFEAGISEKNEMVFLEEIIRPEIGILTNIGIAHSLGFESKQQKLEEKWKLFAHAKKVICNNLNPLVAAYISHLPKTKLFVWGNGDVDLKIINVEKQNNATIISGIYKNEPHTITIPFTDNASVENAINCWCLLLLLNVSHADIAQRMMQLQPVEMRLQLKKAINNCSVINDSYSNDLSSLRIALDFLQQQSGNQTTTVILSDLGETASDDHQYHKLVEALLHHKVDTFIGIGPRLCSLHAMFKEVLPQSVFYLSVEDFIQQFSAGRFKDEMILLKGARAFKFERINLLFEQKVHQTVLEVNLTAMVHNLKEYQRYLQPTTKVMAMVKAFSYGSGSAEVARILQFHKVDYLSVAYADEGVELRKAAIHTPIMVMNPEVVTFPSLVEYNLEPELYSFDILQQFNDYLKSEGIAQFSVHIKIDTGMHRLGFEVGEAKQLAHFLKENPRLVLKSVFSHLAGSENAEHDNFTHQQAADFTQACDLLEQALGFTFTRHLSNSAAIFRYPQYQFDMVRLGIGLYGVDSIGESQLNLVPVAMLRSTIAQIRTVKAGESIGYSRKGIAHEDSLIATIRIGYADGFSRRLGNGTGYVFVNGKMAPVIGNVCMDMTMIDVTHIPGVSEGDVVEIFGTHIPVQQVAAWCSTIPYEIMTGISQRVKREYFEE